MAQRFFTLILLLCSTSVFAGLFDAPGRSTFIPADQAFVFDFQQNQHDLNLNWQVKDGYYLYRKQVSFTLRMRRLASLSCLRASGTKMSSTAKAKSTVIS